MIVVAERKSSLLRKKVVGNESAEVEVWWTAGHKGLVGCGHWY